MKEIWKWIPDYKGLYKVSSNGRIRSYYRKRPKIMKLLKGDHGYLFIDAKKDKKRFHLLIHRSVAKTFLENKSIDYDVHHKDGAITNNRVENLEWIKSKDHNKGTKKVKEKV